MKTIALMPKRIEPMYFSKLVNNTFTTMTKWGMS